MSYVRYAVLFRQSTTSEREAGLAWYDQARASSTAIANKYGVPPLTMMAVVAALSPNANWNRNVIDAANLTDAWVHKTDAKVSTYNSNKLKALQILGSNEVYPYLRGQKVRSFFEGMAGYRNAAVIDSHMLNAYMGRVVFGASRPYYPGTPGLIRKATLALRKAARTVGESVRDTQATIWLVWRRKLAPTDDKGETK